MAEVTPSSLDELAAALRETTGSVGVRGRGTKARWGAAGGPPDLVVDLSSLDRVVEHAAGDQVVTVEAGVPLDALQGALAAHRQWLALDPAEADGSVGGTLATAASGPRRLRFGPPRDLLLGVTVVLADGTVARSGGKVVKNVAGYDLGKLFTGSYGTLGVIARATFRLHPAFVAQRCVTTTAVDDPWPVVRQVLRSPAAPTAIEWRDGTLDVLLESSEAGVDAQAASVADITGGSVTGAPPDGFGVRPWRDGDLALKVTFRLSALSDVVRTVRDLLPDARIAAHAGSGVAYVGTAAGADALPELRTRLSAYDGTVVVVDAPDEVKATLDVWGPVPGLDLMRRIKERFDPDRRMNPGRFVGGI